MNKRTSVRMTPECCAHHRPRLTPRGLTPSCQTRDQAPARHASEQGGCTSNLPARPPAAATGFPDELRSGRDIVAIRPGVLSTRVDAMASWTPASLCASGCSSLWDDCSCHRCSFLSMLWKPDGIFISRQRWSRSHVYSGF